MNPAQRSPILIFVVNSASIQAVTVGLRLTSKFAVPSSRVSRLPVPAQANHANADSVQSWIREWKLPPC